MKRAIGFGLATWVFVVASGAVASPWGKPSAAVIPEADGYIVVPGAARPSRARVYRAIFDATRSAARPDQLVPAFNMAGSELNVLVGTGVPIANAKFAVVVHGSAIDGILAEPYYRAKFGVGNPNLELLKSLRNAGVDIFVCGQNLAFENIDPKTLSPDVTVAVDALVVLMDYQADGYALLSF